MLPEQDRTAMRIAIVAKMKAKAAGQIFTGPRSLAHRPREAKLLNLTCPVMRRKTR